MIGLELDLARWWPLLLLIPALPFVIQSSLSSLPVQSSARNWVLTGLRVFSLFLVILLLLGPTISWQEETRQKPLVAVMLDNSRSLPALGGDLAPVDWLPQLKQSLDDAELVVYSYGDSLRLVSAEFNPDYEEAISDPAAALNALANVSAGRELAALLFTGDGVVTRGLPPLEAAKKLACPVIVAASGRSTAPPDIALLELSANDEVLPGIRQSARVTHTAHGLLNQAYRLRFKLDGQVIDSLECNPLDDGLVQEQEFFWMSPAEGDALLEAEAVLLGGREVETENNSRSLVVRVLPGKKHVLLLAGQPSADLAFIRRGLGSDHDRVQLDFIMAPGRDTSSDQIRKAAARANLIVFVDWPTTSAEPLAAELLGLGKAELHIGRPGRNESAGPAERIEALRAHAILGEESRLDWLRMAWHDMPPIAGSDFHPPAASCLLEDDKGQGLVWIAETGASRRAWLSSSGYWRWELAGGIDRELGLRARQFRDTLLSWLLASPETRRFHVMPEARTWGRGVPMTFDARLFREDGVPLGDAELLLTMEHEDGSQVRAAFNPLGEGRYQAVIQGMKAGIWTWSASAQRGDQPALHTEGSVMIERWSPEDQARQRNQKLLSEMASVTGGLMLDLDNPADRARLANASAFQDIVLRPVLGMHVHRRELIEEWILLVLLLGSLGLEWVLRRLMGRL
jgi:hypothetical protein